MPSSVGYLTGPNAPENREEESFRVRCTVCNWPIDLRVQAVGQASTDMVNLDGSAKRTATVSADNLGITVAADVSSPPSTNCPFCGSNNFMTARRTWK